MNIKFKKQMIIAQECLTYSKRADQFIKGVSPSVWTGNYKHGFKSGNKKYIDFVCGLGANIKGFQNIRSIPSFLEEEAAKILKKKIPFIEKVKFLKTGSEACTAALKIASSYINPSEKNTTTVLSAGYHGWHTEKALKPYTYTGFSKIEDLEGHLNGIISFKKNNIYPEEKQIVIIEPVQLLNSLASLKKIRKYCTYLKYVLIFDEIITGFRVNNYCISQQIGIYPDLICFGKAMANGFPLSAVAGKKEIMESNYFVSSTFAGEESSLKEFIKTMKFLTLKKLEILCKAGIKFLKSFNLLSEKIQIIGYNTRGELTGEYKFLFMQEMAKIGYFFGTAWFLNYDNISILKQTLKDSEKVIRKIEKSEEEGRKIKLVFEPRPIFRRN